MTYKNKVKELVSEESFINLVKYVEMIEEKNKVMNLTGFKDDRLWEEGIYESIILLQKGFGITESKKILDIGAGAGFPSVPYLIAHPTNELTIYEPTKKRTLFLEEVKRELGLNLTIQNIRAEDSEQVEYFDLITARAVASFKILAEISHKPAKVGAIFAFIKGPKAAEEVSDAIKMRKELPIHPEIEEVVLESRTNNIIRYKKEAQTPSKYPRKWIDIIKG